MSGTLVNTFLREKAGQNLRADIYSSENGYNINYFINGSLQKSQSFAGQDITFVESTAKNWINSVEVLNG